MLANLLRRIAAQTPALDAVLHVANRVTQEKLRLKYMNLGDFGGTDPIYNHYVLEIAGPTFEYRDTLKRLGLRWSPTAKNWELDAIEYKYSTRNRAIEYQKNRRLQEKAFPVLKELVKTHNEKIEAEITPAKLSPKEWMAFWDRSQRAQARLKDLGIELTWSYPNEYENTEPKVFVRGNTYPYVSVMKQHGFRWDGSKKSWWTAADEFRVRGEKWMSDILRQVPAKTQNKVVTTPFSDMNYNELHAFILPYIHAEFEALEHYDGEVSFEDAVAQAKYRLRKLSPEQQTAQYEEMVSKGPDRFRWLNFSQGVFTP